MKQYVYLEWNNFWVHDCMRFHLYIDDTGSRLPDKASEPRHDGMDHFALGGILIREDDLARLSLAHNKLVKTWKLNAPLRSSDIRGRRKGFSWLKEDETRAAQFHRDLDAFIVSLPIIAMACVIDRPGYRARYAGKHDSPWLLCRTAFSILIERSCRYAQSHKGVLRVFYEAAGKAEDRRLEDYMRSLKRDGMPFEGSAQAGYESLGSEVFQSTIVGEMARVTKAVPMIQVADLVLYAMAKGGYDPAYRPFRALHDAKIIMDAVLPEAEIPRWGVKYSCFDTKKAR